VAMMDMKNLPSYRSGDSELIMRVEKKKRLAAFIAYLTSKTISVETAVLCIGPFYPFILFPCFHLDLLVVILPIKTIGINRAMSYNKQFQSRK